jgi:DNA polymerase-3 subunit delta
MKYIELKQKLSRRETAPLYVLYGEEDYLIEDILKNIERLIFCQGLKDLNYQLFYADEAQATEIINAALTLPMLAPKRLIVVKSIQKMNPQQLKKISDYATKPSPTSVLVLIGDKLDNRKAWLKSMESFGVVVRFYPLYEQQLTSWIKMRVKEEGYRINSEAVQILLDLTGNDLATLNNQLEKLFAYKAQEKAIFAEDVEMAAGQVRQYNIFELVEAIGNKRLDRALHILSEILAHGEPPSVILALASRQLRQIWRAKDMLSSGNSWDTISRQLKIRRFLLEDFKSQTALFGVPELESAFRQLLITDLKLKSGTQLPRLIMELLVFELCRKSAPARQ